MKVSTLNNDTCIACKYKFTSGADKIKHLKTIHNLTFEKYIIKNYYNNIHPTCNCGCNQKLSFKAFKDGNWFSKYTKNHFVRKPHTEKTKQLIKENSLNAIRKKFGVDNVFQLDEIKEKSKATKLEKYGDANYNNLGKFKNTMLRLYGVDNPHKDIGIKNKIRESRLENFKKFCLASLNITCNNVTDDYFPSMDSHVYKFTCNVCNYVWDSKKYFIPCPVCNKKSRSKLQSEIENFLMDDLKITNIKTNTKSILPDMELDIYIPNIKVAIEFNGNYWHSELNGKTRSYHVKKLKQCNIKGIRLIQIFEDEWIHKNSIVKSRLMHILNKDVNKIYARSCIIRNITSKEKSDYLNEYHIQGNDNSSIHIGAFHKDELVSVMTFGGNRIALGNKKTTEAHYELIRFCVSKNVIGIAGKLLSNFIKNNTPSKIVSYADKRWVDEKNNIYKSLNFNFIRNTPPNYWYMHRSDYLSRVHRYSFRKSQLHKKLKNFDSSLSEWENMKVNGYDRIWDCGNFKYELNILKDNIFVK